MNLVAHLDEDDRGLLPREVAELERRLCEIEWRIEQRRMPEAIRRLNDLGAAIDLHLRNDLAERVGDAELPVSQSRAVVRSLLWRAHQGFRFEADGARETVSALADLRELLVDHARNLHGR